jgi:putative transcriptional regulator
MVMSKKRLRNKDLAAKLNITANSVYRLRKTDEMPRLTPQRLEGICAALNCQPGELLEWVAPYQAVPLSSAKLKDPTVEEESNLGLESVIVQQAFQNFDAVPAVTLKSIVRHYYSILALSWRGYVEYGRGAVVFTDLSDGPKLAYVEQEGLEDIDCINAIDRSDPETSAVVLYYESPDYSTGNYSVLILTGPKSPPECFALSYKLSPRSSASK